MTTYCSSYEHSAAADDAVARLLAAGVDGEQVRILMGSPDRDGDPTGGFAGAVTADAPLGTFAGQSQDHAMGGFAGPPATRRHGSFATIDRETVTTIAGGRHREVRDIGHGRLIRLLVEAGLDEDAAARDVQALHDGRVLVLVHGDRDVEALL